MKQTRQTLIAALFIFLLIHSALAEETSFRREKLVNAEKKQTNATLVFNDAEKSVQVRPIEGKAITVPYSEIDKFSYEYTRKHRIGLGSFILLGVSIAGGIIVMCTQSTRHWLNIDYHVQDAPQDLPRNLVVRLDKRNYRKVLAAVKEHTGKDVEFLGCQLCKMKNSQ